MLEERGNIWNKQGDAYCITTNGFVKKDGRAVMGRGIALEAKKMIRDLDHAVGAAITFNGNHVYPFWNWIQRYDGESGEEITYDLLTFPVKHNWWEHADIDLIKRSCSELMKLADEQGSYWKRILLPRPGCGNGKLDWDYVKEEIEPLLDDRVIVVTF